jgi:opacity protein-like surface antigen
MDTRGHSRPRHQRGIVLAGGVALAVGLVGSSGAWAQCRNNFNVNFFAGGLPFPASAAFPLGGGSAVSALTSTINTVNTAFLTGTSAFVSAPGNPAPDQQGGGAWSRVIGGTMETNTQSTSTLDLSKVAPPIATSGTQTCDTTTRSDYWGFQVGHDISILNGGGTGANWHFGVMAGYLEARTKDITPAGSFTNLGTTFFTEPGTFAAFTQVPFVGAYTAFTKGNFAFDAQARWDFYQNSLTEPINGLFDQQLDGRGFSLTANAAYNIPLQNRWFVEPSAGVVFSRVELNSLDVPGIFGPAGGLLGRGRLAIDDIESVLGRASVSVGTTFTQGVVTWQPYFTASVFHEFAGDVTAKSTITGTLDPGVDNAQLTLKSSGGIGTYAQFALGTAALLGNSGWLAYARTDYRIGDRVEGLSANAGLRYQFSPPAARGLKDSAPAVYGYNWTGPYIGAFAGSTWGEEHWRFIGIGTTVNPEFAGYIAGGQIGYNVQVSNVVFGVEADYGLSNANGGRACPNALFFSCNAEVDNLGSITGRLGLAWGHALFYAKGGLAFGDVRVTSFLDNPVTKVADDTHWRYGWTVGGGMEFALTDRWSAKAEYMYYDLGSERFQTEMAPFPVNFSEVDTRGSAARIGINYHFAPRCCEGPLK